MTLENDEIHGIANIINDSIKKGRITTNEASIIFSHKIENILGDRNFKSYKKIKGDVEYIINKNTLPIDYNRSDFYNPANAIFQQNLDDLNLIKGFYDRYKDFFEENFNKISFGKNYIGFEIDGKILKIDRLNTGSCTEEQFLEKGKNIKGKRLLTEDEINKMIDLMPGSFKPEKVENLFSLLGLMDEYYFIDTDDGKLGLISSSGDEFPPFGDPASICLAFVD